MGCAPTFANIENIVNPHTSIVCIRSSRRSLLEFLETMRDKKRNDQFNLLRVKILNSLDLP